MNCFYHSHSLEAAPLQTDLQKCGKVNTWSLKLLERRIFEETLTSRNTKQKSATLWQIFSSIESAPANRKKGFYTNRNPNK